MLNKHILLRMRKGMATALLLTLCVLIALPSAHGEDQIIVDGTAFDLAVQMRDLYEAAPAAPFVTLQRGAKGEGVMQVQIRLSELGYYSGKISGDFLDGTDAATRSFQKANKLAVNGKVTPTTWNAMMSPEAIGKDGRKHPPQNGQPYVEETVDADAAIAAGATPVPVSAYAFTRKLQYGSQGDDVRLLQQRLRDLGYFSDEIKISGNYYANTRSAVRAFQSNNGLKVDGVAGVETQNALWGEFALDARSTPRPTPTPAPMEYMLKVDVTNQVTSAYTYDETGAYTVLVRQMICSTGTRSHPTPLKTTQSKGSRARWGYFPEWNSHAQYLTRIDSKNAFHSVLYSAPDTKKLIVGAYNALGTRASHGCVRLLVDDAKWIYDNCPSRTTITVFEGEPDPELTRMLKPPPLDRRTMLPQQTPAPTAPPTWDPATPPPPYRILNKGATGADVWWLQTKLTTLGYYRGTVSGGYFEGTAAAVKAFQKDAGLQADGVAGPITLKELYENPAYASPPDSFVQFPGSPPDAAMTPIPINITLPGAAPSEGVQPAPTAAPAQDGMWLTPPPAPTPSPGGGVG